MILPLTVSDQWSRIGSYHQLWNNLEWSIRSRICSHRQSDCRCQPRSYHQLSRWPTPSRRRVRCSISPLASFWKPRWNLSFAWRSNKIQIMMEIFAVSLSSESAWPTPYYACFSGYLIQIRYLYGSLSRGQGKRTNHKVVTIWVEQWNTFVATINVTTFKFCNNLRKVVIFTTFKRCNIFTISNEIKCALSVKKSYFNEKNDQNFHICLQLGPRGLTAKYPVFFDELPFRKPVKHYLADFFLLRGEGWYPLIPLRRILLKSRYFRSKNSLFAFFIYS